jgi:hypothetical protein
LVYLPDERHALNIVQIEFTKNARTSDHMFIIKCIIDKYCKTKDGTVYACFVDFKKAFDTVIHTGIKIKLLSIGVGSKFSLQYFCNLSSLVCSPLADVENKTKSSA